VLVERNEAGDDEDMPLKLKLVKPRKRPAAKKKAKEPAGVGGRGGSGEEPEVDETGPDEADSADSDAE
jgi:hypothetical protein